MNFNKFAGLLSVFFAGMQFGLLLIVFPAMGFIYLQLEYQVNGVILTLLPLFAIIQPGLMFLIGKRLIEKGVEKE